MLLPNLKDKSVNKSMFLVCFLLMVFSCGTSKKASVPLKPKVSNTIVFLNYKLKKLPNGNKEVEFISKKVTEGILKKGVAEATNNPENLVCIQYNKNGKALNKTIIENPLRKSLEFIDDEMRLKTKVLDLKEADFSVRMQLDPKAKYVLMKNFLEDITLIKTKINP
ncbi:hypothetical protein GSB9_01704 [Flavobacteriaceae bacterium GSB9]|nr:hypothetical protein GSB9_01704 [Flavobacteriaceae bacterium GSB9]